MPLKLRSLAFVALALVISLAAPSAQAPAPAPKVTTPEQFFGHPIGADYVLPNYTKFTEYVRKLDAESDRMVVQSIGKTAEGRDQLMSIITAPENFKKLDRYREISRRLSQAEGLTDDQARALAKEGKAVIWIDGGLHATEVLGAQQLIETIYQFNSKNDEETLRILKDVIILATHANPDGMELVSNWYMRNTDQKQRSTGQLPRLYQKYIGHDNNRDFYMMNQPESVNMNRILYREWFPQIMYNHHQTGPTGTVMFSPPFRDPFNYVFDPIVVNTLDQVGAAMHTRFDAEGKPGVTTRSGSNYSTWWNGGLRTMAYFHNQVGLLTESIGNPTPQTIGFVPDRVIARGDLPFPITPQVWHFRQSIDYSLTANYAVLDFAQRYRESLLYNIYLAGRNSIKRGNTDNWTVYPRRVAEVKDAIAKDMKVDGGSDSRMVSGGRIATVPEKYYAIVRKPEYRDPRGYILSANEGDFLTATKFVNIMIRSGLTAHRATAPFTVAGKQYPAGSYVFKGAQAFRPHLLDMFEPQDHPNDFQYPGGPPIPPYDSAGWTLAFQMGLKFDRVLEAFDGPFEKIPDVIKPAPGKVTDTAGAVGYVVNHRNNDAFIAINRLLKANEEAFFVGDRGYQSADGTGVIYITAKPTTGALLARAAADLGLSFTAVTQRPAGAMYKLTKPRIGLWDQYGGSMPSGHLRWLLEQFEFDFERVFPATLDAGNLKAKYDVILFPDGGIPETDSAGGGGGGGFGGPAPNPQDIPEEFRAHLGRVSIAKTVPQLKAFAEAGGVLVAFGGSAVLGHHLDLPVSDHLVEVAQDGTERPLPGTKFYIPGSILSVAVDNTNPVAFGFEKKVDVFFDASPVLELAPDAALRGVKTVAWFDTKTALRSGWAWGQHYLEGGTAAVEAQLGRGKVFLFGPEITFRAQPHGTFKFLFNSIYYGTSVPAGAATTTTTAQP
ncbi:MAG: peptidase [Acidobacteria bacterium RIFCSPLOWO2_12_FULL_67_14b]|nr:MAG: peptidase [Acidobacteria bacterium RIFCSPLOWO2_12_FULL_67_14b]